MQLSELWNLHGARREPFAGVRLPGVRRALPGLPRHGHRRQPRGAEAAEQFLPRDEAGGEDEPWQGERFDPFPRDDEWVD